MAECSACTAAAFLGVSILAGISYSVFHQPWIWNWLIVLISWQNGPYWAIKCYIFISYFHQISIFHLLNKLARPILGHSRWGNTGGQHAPVLWARHYDLDCSYYDAEEWAGGLKWRVKDEEWEEGRLGDWIGLLDSYHKYV